MSQMLNSLGGNQINKQQLFTAAFGAAGALAAVKFTSISSSGLAFQGATALITHHFLQNYLCMREAEQYVKGSVNPSVITNEKDKNSKFPAVLITTFLVGTFFTSRKVSLATSIGCQLISFLFQKAVREEAAAELLKARKAKAKALEAKVKAKAKAKAAAAAAALGLEAAELYSKAAKKASEAVSKVKAAEAAGEVYPDVKAAAEAAAAAVSEEAAVSEAAALYEEAAALYEEAEGLHERAKAGASYKAAAAAAAEYKAAAQELYEESKEKAAEAAALGLEAAELYSKAAKKVSEAVSKVKAAEAAGEVYPDVKAAAEAAAVALYNKAAAEFYTVSCAKTLEAKIAKAKESYAEAAKALEEAATATAAAAVSEAAAAAAAVVSAAVSEAVSKVKAAEEALAKAAATTLQRAQRARVAKEKVAEAAASECTVKTLATKAGDERYYVELTVKAPQSLSEVKAQLHPVHYVFCLDRSSSMNTADRSPVLQRVMSLFFNRVGEEKTAQPEKEIKVSVVAYDNKFEVVLDRILIQQNNYKGLSNQVRHALSPRGATTMRPALEKATELIITANKVTQLLNLVVLTDGDDHSFNNLDDLQKQWQGSGVSTYAWRLGEATGGEETLNKVIQTSSGVILDNSRYAHLVNNPEEGKLTLEEAVNEMFEGTSNRLHRVITVLPSVASAGSVKMLNSGKIGEFGYDIGGISAGDTITKTLLIQGGTNLKLQVKLDEARSLPIEVDLSQATPNDEIFCRALIAEIYEYQDQLPQVTDPEQRKARLEDFRQLASGYDNNQELQTAFTGLEGAVTRRAATPAELTARADARRGR